MCPFHFPNIHRASKKGSQIKFIQTITLPHPLQHTDLRQRPVPTVSDLGLLTVKERRRIDRSGPVRIVPPAQSFPVMHQPSSDISVQIWHNNLDARGPVSVEQYQYTPHSPRIQILPGKGYSCLQK